MKPRKRKLIVSLVLGLLVAVAGGLYVTHHYQFWPFLPTHVQPDTVQSVNYSPPTLDELTTGTSTKQTVVDSTASSSTNQASTTGQPLDVSFSAVQPGETVYIRTLIDIVSGSGTCSLHMRGPSQKSYDAVAPMQALATNSTCQGFNIPMTSLANGTWTITVTVTDGGRTGSVTTEKVL